MNDVIPHTEPMPYLGDVKKMFISLFIYARPLYENYILDVDMCPL